MKDLGAAAFADAPNFLDGPEKHGVALMIFLKGLAGGVGAVCITWIIIVVVDVTRINMMKNQQHLTGLTAVAGGWTELLHTPIVAILLTVAFGVGLFLTTRAVR